jgi:hypothetical protein
MKRVGETRKESAGHFRGGNEQPIREARAQMPDGMRGAGSPTTHEVTPAQREELDIKLPEISKLDVIAPENPVSTEDHPRPIVDEGLPPTPPLHPALTPHPDCICGKPTPCTSHD